MPVDQKPAENPETPAQEPEFPIRDGFSLAWLTWPFIILAAYALSVGPVARIDEAYNLPRTHPRLEQVLEVIYAPIVATADWPPTARILEWYLRLWGLPL